MTESYVNAKIRRVKQDPRYTVLLQLQRQPRLAPEGQPEQPGTGGDRAAAEAAPHPSTSQGTPPPPQPVGPSPEEEAVDSAGEKVLAATYVSATEVDGKRPPYNKSLET